MQKNKDEALLDKVGLSHKEIFQLMVLKELANQDYQYGIKMYSKMEHDIEGKRVSRSHFYATLQEMKEAGLITLVQDPKDKRKKVYRITQKGLESRQRYMETHLAPLLDVQAVIDQMIYDITKQGKKEILKELPDEHQLFFSKLVYVRELISYILIKRMTLSQPVVIADLIRFLRYRYGWIPGEGYIYEVVRDIEKKNWIVGKWESDRRGKRYYRLTDRGLMELPKLEEATLTSLRSIKKFINSILSKVGQ